MSTVTVTMEIPDGVELHMAFDALAEAVFSAGYTPRRRFAVELDHDAVEATGVNSFIASIEEA